MADHGDWILKIISGPHQGVEELLPEGRLLVGTGPDCGIVLHDVLIAAQHFALTRKGGTVTVEALGGRTYCRGKRVTAPTAVPAFSFVTAGTTHIVLGPAAGSWPLLSSADAPELEKDPPPAAAAPTAAPAAAPATPPPAASPAPVAPATPGTPAAPTPEQRRRAWWMAGFGGALLVVWLILWLLLRPAPSEPARPSPKARTERLLGSLPGGNRIRIEERGGQLAISGYLDSDAAHRDLIAALRAEVPEATLRLWSTPRLVETARAFLASRKLNLTLTPGENGALTIAGTAPSAPEWAVARQLLLAEVPGLQNIIDEVTAPKELVKGAKASTEPAVAPDKALTVIALQTLPEGPAWVRLANGAVYFAGGRFQGIATFTGLEGAKARFEHDGSASLFGLGDDLAVLLPARPAKSAPNRLEPAPRRAAPPPPAVAPAQPAPTPAPAPVLSDTKPVEPTPAPVAATRAVLPEATPSPAPAAPPRPASAPTPTPVTTVAATPTPAPVVPATEAATPAAAVLAETAPASTAAPAQPVVSSPAPETPAASPAPMPSDAKSVEPAPVPIAATPAPAAEAPTPVATAPADAPAAPTPASPAPAATLAATPTPAPVVPATEATTPAPAPAPAAEAPVAAAPEPLPPLPAEYVKNPTEAKIRLISDALQARDAGDLAAAQRALSLLARLLPNDGAVLRLRTDIEARVLAQQQVRPTPAL